MLRHPLLCLMMVLLTAPCLVEMAGAAPPQVQLTVADTIKKLRDVPLPGFPPTDVPGSARPLLTRLKHQLLDLISDEVNAREQQARTPEEIRAAILERLSSQGVSISKESDTYGSIEALRVEKSTEHPDLLVAITTLTVPCGDDSSVYVFQNSSPGWKLVLAQESNHYPTVGGAQGAIQYSLSSRDASGKWFLVTADVGPWCSSAWHGLRYKVLRPGATPFDPKVLLSKYVGIYEGCDEWYKLTAWRDGFQISHLNYQSLDPAKLVRVHLERYAVSADRVTRVPPLALLPQDFLDEWVRLPWEEAVQWTRSPKLNGIRTWHERLQRSQSRSYYSEFDFVQPCGKEKQPAHWQIGVWIEAKNRPEGLPDELFFTIAQERNDFYVEDVSTKRPPGCRGHSSRVATSGCSQLP